MINFLDTVMETAAQSLGSALENYWPSKVTRTCDIPERNASLHCAIALASHGLHVFQELDFGREASNRLDLLALGPKSSYALYFEFKCYTGSSMRESTQDLDRVNEFSLNRRFDPHIFGTDFVARLTDMRCEVGVVAGTLWRSAKSSENLTSEAQKQFEAKVTALGGTVCKRPHLIRRYSPAYGGDWDGAFYLYWAVVRDWKQKVGLTGLFLGT